MRAVLGFVVLLCAMPVLAADNATAATADNSAAYQRIDALRAQEMADFKTREAACYERFAVNDCLKKLQPAHRAVLDDLKRQEIKLHDSERAQQGVEQLQRAEQKALEKKQSDAQAAEAAARVKEKSQAQQEKQAAHAAQAASDAAKPSAAPSGPGATERTVNAARYAAKQAAAQKKREEVAKRLKDKQKGKLVPPLPLPPK